MGAQSWGRMMDGEICHRKVRERESNDRPTE